MAKLKTRKTTRLLPSREDKGNPAAWASEKALLIDSLKKVVDGVSKTFGPRCEVVLHDLSDPARSIVHIANGCVSGRSVGGSITDLGLKTLQSGFREDDLINYRSLARDGRVLKSSTIAFRDPDGEPAIALCVNLDITDILNFNAAVQSIFEVGTEDGRETMETFEVSAVSTLGSMAEKAIQQTGKAPSTMTKSDRVEIVRHLEEQGFFLIKGAIKLLCARLGLSKFTVYNYLNDARRTCKRR